MRKDVPDLGTGGEGVAAGGRRRMVDLEGDAELRKGVRR